jgi:hypothetical protein
MTSSSTLSDELKATWLFAIQVHDPDLTVSGPHCIIDLTGVPLVSL